MLNAVAVTLFPFATFHTVDTAARSLLGALADYTVRGTLIFVAAWIVAALLRRSAAGTRYAVWTVAVAMVAALPLLSRATPPIAVSLPVIAPIPTASASSTVPVGTTPSASRPVQPLPVPPIQGRLGTSEPRQVRVAAAPVQRERAAIDIPLVVVGLWLAGALCLLLRFVVGTIVVWRRALDAEHVMDAGWVMLTRDVARELSIRRPVTLLMAEASIVPVTWGIIYPMVLLPRDAVTWPRARRRIVLLHELAHVARFDAATQLVGQLVLAANWFNPLAWVAMGRMRAEREGACDDIVLTRGTRASAYAEDLLTLVRALRPATTPGFAALAMARQAELEGRLRCILDGRRRRAQSSLRASVLSLVTAAPFVLFLAAVRPELRPPHPTAIESASPFVAHVAAIVQSVARAALPSPRLTVAFHAVLPSPRLTVALHALQAPALPSPARVSLYRCPVDAEFIHGGVSADGGRPAALEAEHDDHRILVLADDGRCVSGRIDGQVALSSDASDVSGLGVRGRLTITEETDGHSRRAEVVVASTDAEPKPGYYIFGQPAATAPMYVIDGTIVNDDNSVNRVSDVNPDDIEKLKNAPGSPKDGSKASPRDTSPTVDTTKLWIIQRNNIDATIGASVDKSSGYPMVTNGSVRGRSLVAFRYSVDGQPRSWGDGRDWFHSTLAQLVRETGYNARDRVVQLRLHGGVPAVLDEIRHVRSEMGTRAYFDALVYISGDGPNKLIYGQDQAAYARLSPDDAKQAADLAKSMLPPSADRDRIVSELGGTARTTSVHVF